ncbi:hypothetical protein G9U53_32795 [Rhodococcus sp. D-46]|jgi:hypothetical protein|uniref:Conserved hypothetical membrane protein n=2 Tax=Rhodococcus erythropolis TaxID=1833 RepID=Q3L9D9_RHOE4|nr:MULTISPECIES: hypothetical protein [Rhodococcus]NHE69080.1 hypothetical protein [Rhodococcus sp. D-46]EQM29773.1 hypothetical protein N601_31120 [Rhodococcus erythropolis DN1]MBF7737690.1 hypothetical protein [Rhodococcus erythropolis]MBS2993576.1 hypothetical protein [Rhodococcus erythropolis]MBW0282286.1 hypothetical protein [Rhodococcus sp. FH8]
MPEPAISERPDVDPDGRALTEAGLYRRWGLRVLRGTLAGIATVLVVGIPTDIIDTPMFGREVPVRAWELPVLLASAVLTAVWFGIDKPRQVERTGTPAALGVALTFFAVGCPVCNKLVLLALGTSGALGLWAPIQPILAGVSLTMLAAAVAFRWRRRDCSAGSCAV